VGGWRRTRRPASFTIWVPLARVVGLAVVAVDLCEIIGRLWGVCVESVHVECWMRWQFGSVKRVLRTDDGHDGLELVQERVKGGTKQERLGETKRVKESGYMIVKIESNDVADRRVHGDREVEVERTRRRDEEAGCLTVSPEEERDDTNNLGQDKSRETATHQQRIGRCRPQDGRRQGNAAVAAAG
jgi:hypothetical protein